MLDFILPLVMLFVILAFIFFILALCMYLLKNHGFLGGILAILLWLALVFVINMIKPSVDPGDSPVCTVCQEAMSEDYPYCPYCGEPQTSN